MTGELQEYWETKQRIERKLLIGVGVVLMAIWGTACTQGPTGPYTELEPQQGTIAETQETRGKQGSIALRRRPDFRSRVREEPPGARALGCPRA